MSLGVAASLRIASMASSFLLQSAFAWATCLLTTRIVQSHRTRFRIWMGFLLLFIAQWARMLLIAVAGPVAADRSVTARYAFTLHKAHGVAVMPWTAKDLSTLVTIVFGGYCAVVLVLFVRETASHLRLKRALQYRLAPPVALQYAFDSLVSSHDLKDCSLWLLPGLSSPATLGWWRPQVVLPLTCESHEMEDVQAALWHELKHVQRRDALWNSLMRLCSIVLWFHPSVRYASKAAVRERELACDAEVVQDHPQGRSRYASCLLRFARLGSSTEDSLDRCIGMTSGAGLLDLRIRAILEEATSEGAGRAATRSALAAMMCGAYVVTAPVLWVAFNSSEPFDLNRLTSTTPMSMRPRVDTTGRVNAQRRLKSSISEAQVAVPGVPIPTVSEPGDPALAAEHRAGLNVLTEFNSEMDTSVSDNTTASNPAGQGAVPRLSAPSSTPRFSVPWTSVAVGAAQQLGSLSGGSDHDHD